MDGNVYAVYDPANNVEEEEQYLHFIAEQENNGGEDDEGGPQWGRAQIGLVNSDNEFLQQHMLARQNAWSEWQAWTCSTAQCPSSIERSTLITNN